MWNTTRWRMLGILVLLAVASCDSEPVHPGQGEAPAPAPAPAGMEFEGERVDMPPDILDPPWLETRARAQRLGVRELGVFSDFRFSDRAPESGISFRNRVVDDSAKTYKAVHYDHGNGIAVADVDGDGLHDIYFVTQVGGNELWRNVGGGRFENMTSRAGVAVSDRISVTASFADIDNDGDPDLYVTSVRSGNLLFENDGTGAFRDISSASGLDHQGHSSGAVFFDYDRDGLLDLFLTNVGQYTTESVRHVSAGGEDYEFFDGFDDAFEGHLYPERFEQSLLFKNLGDRRFRDVSSDVGLTDTSWSGDASPLDLNEDGWPDLYVLNMQGNDEYYENVEGTRFVKKSREIFPKTPWGSMGIKVFDSDNDGQMDIYITDMHSDMSEDVGVEGEELKSRMGALVPETTLRSGGASIFGNAFFRNRGNGQFDEISDQIGAENYWPWGFSVGDLNADGYEDVFVASSMNYPFRYGVNSVLLNDRGTQFVDAEFILGVEPRRDGRTAAPWFQLDCSEADRGDENCEGRTGQVVVWSALGSRSSVVFDLDHDGDLDIVTNDFNSEPLVLISDLSDQERPLNFLTIGLVGTTSNRDGLGARVEVQTAAGTYVKVHDGQSGYLSHSLVPLYFGLGEAQAVERIRILWPSGTTQEVSAPIQINGHLQVTEP